MLMKQFIIFTFYLLFPFFALPFVLFLWSFSWFVFQQLNTPRNMSLHWSSFLLRYFNSLLTLFLASSSLVITSSSNDLEYSCPHIKLPVFEWNGVLRWPLMHLSISDIFSSNSLSFIVHPQYYINFSKHWFFKNKIINQHKISSLSF